MTNTLRTSRSAAIELGTQVENETTKSKQKKLSKKLLLRDTGVALYCRDSFMPKKSEDGLSGLLNKKYSKVPDSLIATYGFVEENEKGNAAMADDDGRSILTQHIVKVSVRVDQEIFCFSKIKNSWTVEEKSLSTAKVIKFY